MAAPLLRAEVEIDAPVERVWNLVSDLSRMPQWSPQCRMMKPLGRVAPGTRTINLNRRGLVFWPTMSTLTEVVPQQKFAFRVGGNNSVWSYELEPTDTGTRLIESRHAENGITAFAAFLQNTAFGGVGSFENELVDGMNASLERIKAAAERG